MNFKELALQLGLDEDDIHEAVDLFVTTVPSDIEKIIKAYSKNDMAGLGKAAHSLKGSAATLGFIEIAKDAQILINKAHNNDFEALDLLIPSFMKKMDHLLAQLKKDIRNKKT